MNRSLAGPNERADWFTAYDWAEQRRCFEHQRTGRCSCERKNGRIYNPCDKTDQVLEDLSALSIGDPARNFTMREIIDWFRTRCCRSFPGCRHQACNRAIPIIAFLETQEAAQVAAVAAG
jgi:hypothetical protein